METETEKVSPEEEEQKFELSPEQATGLDGGLNPSLFNRKRVLIVICVSFAVVVCGGLVFNYLKPQKKNPAPDGTGTASSSNTQFLVSMRDRAINGRIETVETAERPETGEQPVPLLPEVTFNPSPEVEPVRARANISPPPPQAPPPAAPPNTQSRSDDASYLRSSLVPAVQGSLFSGAQPFQARQAQQETTPSAYPQTLNPYGNQIPSSEYYSQNNQRDKMDFLNSPPRGGAGGGGQFHGENALWQGTVVPGILVTAINTDLPGSVLARVTQNVYDSLTGRSLLIPQGTLLLARYNSSVSYSQNRVQIVWDTLIRPDGLEIDLVGSIGVDREGMGGQRAEYHENWFEYLKAAGIIALFSVANAKMAEAAARYSSDDAAAGIAASGAQVTAQLGDNIISRALNIQPTLTVDNGTLVNVMINRTLYLPPAGVFPVTQKYFLE